MPTGSPVARGRPPKPFTPPTTPTEKINLSDLDSRNVKTSRGWVQGYNAQAVCTEDQIVIAADITVDSPDFGHLEPMIGAARRDCEELVSRVHPTSCSPMPATGITFKWSAWSATA